MMKKILRLLLPDFLQQILRNKRQQKLISNLTNKGIPVPTSHHIKQITIKKYQKNYNYNILVETGTYLGDMVEAQKHNFKKVYSIELGLELYNKAKKRFKKDQNVVILQGDSGNVITKVLDEITEPAIFWLDGHYSGGITAKGSTECPIFEELSSIFNSSKLNHILLIDDARCFNGEGDYPQIDELTKFILSKNAKYKVEVKDDIIRYAF